MNAKQALELHRKKRKLNAQVAGVRLGDYVEVTFEGEDDSDESGEGRVEVIEIFGSGEILFTVRDYEEPEFYQEEHEDEDGEVYYEDAQEPPRLREEYTHLERSDLFPISSGGTQMEPPHFDIGTKVQVIGDGDRRGAFGTIGYMYNRLVTEDDVDFGATGETTGWRYVVDFKGGVNPDTESGETIEEDDLVELDDQQFAELVGGGNAPEIEGEEDIVIG